MKRPIAALCALAEAPPSSESDENVSFFAPPVRGWFGSGASPLILIVVCLRCCTVCRTAAAAADVAAEDGRG